MGIRDWFGSSNKKHDNDYFSLDDLNRVNKSFHTGQATQRIDNEYIQIGSTRTTNNNERIDKIDREAYLRKKAQLRDYANKDSLVQAIIRTRTNQILQYAVPSRLSSDGNGYQVVVKGKRRSEMNKHEKNVAKELEDFIYHTGKDDLDWRDNFPSFLSKIIYDYYVYDQINIERVFESKSSNTLNHFNHVDAGTILIDKYPTSIDRQKTYVQMLNRKEVAHFNSKELTFLTYWNHSTNELNGYGFSPVESSIDMINYHTNVEQFNARFFTQGGMTRGILLIDPGDGGVASRASLDTLRRNLMPGSGINGSWKIPIIQASDAKFVNLTQSSKDMEFVSFLNYLNNIICANFNIQPDEVNFPNKNGATGSKSGSTLNEGNTTKIKMDASRQNGIVPVMKYIERIISDRILRYVDNRYEFIFTPANENADKVMAEKILAQEKSGMTLNEGRAKMGLPPLPYGDIPGNSDNFIQYISVQSKMDVESNVSQQTSTSYKPGKNKPGNPKLRDDSKTDDIKDNTNADNGIADSG